MEKEEIKKTAISTMFSKYPSCSEKYHMCCDTVGAIATASDKGSLVFFFAWYYTYMLKLNRFDRLYRNLETAASPFFGDGQT